MQAVGSVRGPARARLSKRLGDVEEGPVLDALAGAGWYGRYVDDNGADLIA